MGPNVMLDILSMLLGSSEDGKVVVCAAHLLFHSDHSSPPWLQPLQSHAIPAQENVKYVERMGGQTVK